MRSFALLLLVVALSTLAPAATAQISVVAGSGCPSSTAPQTTGSPQLGQKFTFSWSCALPTRQAIAMLGSARGGGVVFGPPLTCAAGPCQWFPGPIGGGYLQWPAQLGALSWTVAVPNDASLIGASVGLQCVCWCA